METAFKTVRELRDDGLLQRRLLTRIRILTGISLLLLGIGAYDVFKDRLQGFVCLALALIAFVLGLTIFSRMNKVVWDEQKEVIATGRMDVTGFAILVIYLIADYGVRIFLHAQYPNVTSITGYVFCILGGSLLGRSVGTRLAVYKLARKRVESPESI